MARQRVPEAECRVEAGKQPGRVGADPDPGRHLEGVQPERCRGLVADGEDEQVLEAGAGGQPAIVVELGVHRLQHQERHLVVAPELLAEGQGGVRLARAGRADEQGVPGEGAEADSQRVGGGAVHQLLEPSSIAGPSGR
ncbi:hypothetical protein GCM10020000_41970 [Streptomyces olivoverticillatus]